MAIKTIGQLLKEKRTELGLSLSEAEGLTQIQRLFIIALETDDFETLPGDFYIRAYIKQYAEKVGLDGERLVVAYESGNKINVEDEDDYGDNYRFVKPSERVDEEEIEENIEKNWRYYMPIIILSSAALLIIAAVIAVVILNKPAGSNLETSGYTISKSSNSAAQSTSTKNQSTTTNSSSSKAAVEPVEKLTAVKSGVLSIDAKLENPKAAVQVNFEIPATVGQTFTSTSVSVSNSNLPGVVALSGASNQLTSQATLAQTATSSIISFGYVNGTKITVNGQEIDLTQLGDSALGQTVTINLTLEAAKSTESTDTSSTSASLSN